MKYVILIFILIGCSEDPEPNIIGCLTGIPKNSTTREFIRCGTRQDLKQGGYSTGAPLEMYTDHKWEQCDKCK